MQITLSQADIEMAISSYVSEMGINRPITEITFTQSRNPTSVSAEIHLLPLSHKNNFNAKPQQEQTVPEEEVMNEEAGLTTSPETKESEDEEEAVDQANVKSLFS